MPRKTRSNEDVLEKWTELKDYLDKAKRELDRLSGRLESANEELKKFGCSDLQEGLDLVEKKKKDIKELGEEFNEKVISAYNELQKIKGEDDE